MSSNHKVSVIIPVYNSERFLTDSIDSILNQTYPNLEIIVVNDDSTDNSLEILKRFGEKIKVIHQENKGLAGALNTGIQKMTGDWFKWFSPDDIMYPDTIEKLVDSSNKLGDNYIVYSNWDIIDEQGKFIRSFSESNYNDLEPFQFNVRLLDGQIINVNTTLIPSKLFLKGCRIRNLSNSTAVDYDFFLHAGLFYKTKFHLIDKSLIKYRIHSKQFSHQKIVQSLSYIDSLKSEIISKLDSTSKKDYLSALQKYKKNKSLSKKSMALGLKLSSKILPNLFTDKVLVYYLSKLRTIR